MADPNKLNSARYADHYFSTGGIAHQGAVIHRLRCLFTKRTPTICKDSTLAITSRAYDWRGVK